MPERRPERAFRDAATRLNSKNLDHLWHTCALLSFLEREHAQVASPDSLFPLINAPRVNMFAKAVLASTAIPTRTGRLAFGDFSYVYNAVNDASTDPALTRALNSSSGRERQFAGWLHATARSQFPYQIPDLVIRLGRAYALSKAIPQWHRDTLRQTLGERYFDPAQASLDEFGSTVEDVLDVLFRAYAVVRESWKPLQTMLSRALVELGPHPSSSRRSTARQAAVLRRFLDLSWRGPSATSFPTSRLRIQGEAAEGLDRIEAATKHVSRSTLELRTALANQQQFQRGFITYRLSPLERFPLVRTHAGQLVVPVTAHLEQLLGNAAHYLLQEQPLVANAFMETRGRAQEIYLKELLASRAPSLQQVPERSYRGPKGELRGPDVTLIDAQGQRLLLIESKGRRVLTETRVDVDLNAFRRNFDDAIEALTSLPRKSEDIRLRTDAYGDIQGAVEHACSKPPIGVVVVGEGTPFLTELVRVVLTDDERRQVDAADARLMVMGLDLFETAVEIAAAADEPLADVLDDYWEDTALSVSELVAAHRPAAEFRGRPVPLPRDRFATEFADELLERLGYNTTRLDEDQTPG